MYARGILFGKMVIELGDACTARNDAQGLHADLEFKTKGFFSGTYNAIAGRVRHSGTELGEVTGKWSAMMEFKSTKVSYLSSSPRSSHLSQLATDGREAHAIRRTETWQRYRAQVGRPRGRTGTIREPQALARPHTCAAREGHGGRNGCQERSRECAARAARNWC